MNKQNIMIDTIGDNKLIMTINAFTELYNNNKQQFKALNTKFLNNHFSIMDDKKNEYKIKFIKGNMTLKRKTDTDFTYKKELVDEVKRLSKVWSELEFLNDRFREIDKELCEVKELLKSNKHATEEN